MNKKIIAHPKTKIKIDRMEDSLTLNDARVYYWTTLLSGFVEALAPIAVPLAPSAFVGLDVYGLTSGAMPPSIALAVSAVSTAGLEVVGYTTSHTTLRILEFCQRTKTEYAKAYIGAALVLLYMITAICIIVFSHQLTYIAVGVGMVVLTVITYVSSALSKWVRWADDELETEATEAKVQDNKVNEVEAEARQRAYDLEMRKLELSEARKIEVAKAKQQASVDIAALGIPRNSTELPEPSTELPSMSTGEVEILKAIKAHYGDGVFSVFDAVGNTEYKKSAIYRALNSGGSAGVVHNPERGRYQVNGIEELA